MNINNLFDYIKVLISSKPEFEFVDRPDNIDDICGKNSRTTFFRFKVDDLIRIINFDRQTDDSLKEWSKGIKSEQDIYFRDDRKCDPIFNQVTLDIYFYTLPEYIDYISNKSFEKIKYIVNLFLKEDYETLKRLLKSSKYNGAALNYKYKVGQRRNINKYTKLIKRK